jgi:hypothetical protein
MLARNVAETSGALRTGPYWVANGTVGLPLLENIDYWQPLRDNPVHGAALCDLRERHQMDHEGEVTNGKYAEMRAAQWLRQYMEPGCEVSPAFEDWEIYLLDPPN